jgi:hypothetical protein
MHGSDEDAAQYYSEERRHESQPITARVVDPEEERRVVREQVHQVLQEERTHKHAAVIHAGASNVSSSESSYEDRHGRDGYNRRIIHGMADDISSSESSYENVERENAVDVHAAAKKYDRHTAHKNAAVVHCATKNYDSHLSSRGKTAAPRTPKAMDRGNSNSNQVEQNPTFNIQVPVTTSVAQTSP